MAQGVDLWGAVVMMASADEGGAGGLSRRQNLDNPTAPRQPRDPGVDRPTRLRSYAIPVPIAKPSPDQADKLRTML
jgi:hypothetical protein